jgi:hypothetical protein
MVSGSSLLRRLVLLASLSVALPGVSAQQVILPKPSQIYPTIWPQPKMMQINESIPNGGPTLYVDPDDFSVTWDQSIDSRDPLLTQSQTLMHRLFPISADDQLDMSLGKLTGLFVHVDCPQCPFGIDALDQTGTSESYNLSITLDSNGNGVAQLYAPTSWGAIWGLESFVQLLSVVGGNYLLYNSSVTVYDAPRFAYRGVMIDTANHFIDTKTLRHILDGMSANKLNVLHWMQRSAVTTSIQSDVFANLTELGSFDPTESVYTQDDVFDLVSYAEQRGIHVVIENGGLENAAAIGASHPEVIACPNLLAQGYPMNLQVAMDPFANATFDFLANYWHELDQSSTDFVHLGGDQISHACWRESASVRQYREDNPGTSYDDIQALFITNVWNGIMQNPGNGDPTQPFPIFSYSQSIMYRASVDNYPGCFPQDEFAPGWFNVTFEAKDQQTVAAVAEAQLSVIYSGDAWDLTSSTTQAKAVVAGMMDTFDDWIDVYMYNITDGVQNPDWLQYGQ